MPRRATGGSSSSGFPRRRSRAVLPCPRRLSSRTSTPRASPIAHPSCECFLGMRGQPSPFARVVNRFPGLQPRRRLHAEIGNSNVTRFSRCAVRRQRVAVVFGDAVVWLRRHRDARSATTDGGTRCRVPNAIADVGRGKINFGRRVAARFAGPRLAGLFAPGSPNLFQRGI